MTNYTKQAEEEVIQEFERECGLILSGNEETPNLRNGPITPDMEVLFDIAVRDRAQLIALREAVGKELR